jgi:hypothetical protein
MFSALIWRMIFGHVQFSQTILAAPQRQAAFALFDSAQTLFDMGVYVVAGLFMVSFS